MGNYTSSNGVLSSGKVARMMHVCSTTVNRWYDKGMLKGFRVPGGRDRRFMLKDVEAFAEKYQIPLNLEGLQSANTSKGNAQGQGLEEESCGTDNSRNDGRTTHEDPG